MNIVLSRTGDPWMDWGLVAMYDHFLKHRKHFKKLTLTPGHLVLEISDNSSPGKCASRMYNYLRECLNELILPAPEMKGLQIEHRMPGENGFYDPRYKINLDSQQKAELKGKLKNINSKPEVTLRRNYVGLKNDWSKLGNELQEAVDNFWAQHSEEGNFKNTCHLCGRSMAKNMTYKMRQNKNPFYNQHHNNRIRGHTNNVTTGEMCPTCNLLNIYAAVQYNTPYFIDGNRTHLLLPRIDDLIVLHKIFCKIKSRLKDLLAADLFSYSTNISELRRHNVYQAITGVYFNIVHRYMLEEDVYREDPLVEESERQAVRRWVVLRYSKGTNVNFAHFNHLDIDPRLFELVRALKYGSNNSKEGNVYTTFLSGISCREPGVLNDLAKGVVQGRWSAVADSLLAVKKELRKPSGKAWTAWNALEFFEVFIKYALTEVDDLLEKQLAEDVKKLGNTLGSNFKDDIALFTSLNNAPDIQSFIHVLKDAFLKLHKINAAGKKKDEEQNLWVVKKERIDNILNSLTEDNIDIVKDTLLIYAVLSALRKRPESKDEQSKNAEAGGTI